jgi:hypothetical protein
VSAWDRACQARSRRDHYAWARRGGVVPASSPVAEVEGDDRGEYRCGAAVLPGKEGAGGAH